MKVIMPLMLVYMNVMEQETSFVISCTIII